MRLRLFQISRIKAFDEPPVNRSQQFARLLHLTLVAPELREGRYVIGEPLQPASMTEASNAAYQKR